MKTIDNFVGAMEAFTNPGSYRVIKDVDELFAIAEAMTDTSVMMKSPDKKDAGKYISIVLDESLPDPKSNEVRKQLHSVLSNIPGLRMSVAKEIGCSWEDDNRKAEGLPPHTSKEKANLISLDSVRIYQIKAGGEIRAELFFYDGQLFFGHSIGFENCHNGKLISGFTIDG